MREKLEARKALLPHIAKRAHLKINRKKKNIQHSQRRCWIFHLDWKQKSLIILQPSVSPCLLVITPSCWSPRRVKDEKKKLGVHYVTYTRVYSRVLALLEGWNPIESNQVSCTIYILVICASSSKSSAGASIPVRLDRFISENWMRHDHHTHTFVLFTLFKNPRDLGREIATSNRIYREGPF